MKNLRIFISIILLVSSAIVSAQDIQITHTAREAAKAGERVRLRIKVDNPGDIDLVRLYFRSDLNSKFNFVQTKQLGKYIFAGQLPAATKDAKSVEYVFLIRDKAKKIIKTQKFSYAIKGEIPLVERKTAVKVFSELDKAPKALEGFDDNIQMDVAESGAKLAVVAGLYETQTTAAAATTSGSTTTTAAGISTTTIFVAAGAGGAAIIGVAASGGGGSDGGTDTETVTVIEFQAAQYSGSYDWNCDTPEDISEGNMITLDLSESNGIVTGTANYLGGQAIITNGAYNEVTGAISFDLPATSSTVSNSFAGFYDPNDQSNIISGTTTKGDYQVDGANGCTSSFGPAGTITAW